ncbi:MAG: DNA gyrase subunit A [Sphaerochaetaceae bacterium]|nr:DNA gyrase subunit A [Sphaerochaetaceae bacterium]
MHKIIPIYYSEYGRYINRFRAIPSHIDCLKPVERRLLLTLHEVAKNDVTKSAKVIGNCLGKYHPHGDQSIYKTLINLVKQEYAEGQGNWGSQGLINDPAAAYRYTEIKLEPWVENLVFSHINFVPYDEFELEPEPIYLPCPVPIGLIGNDIITGISFYRTLIPKFTLKDLVRRLIYVLDPENNLEIKILPNFKNCKVVNSEDSQIDSILKSGTGSLTVSPFGDIDMKNKLIRVQGLVPISTFAELQKNIDKLDINIIDGSKKDIIIIEPRKKNTNLIELAKQIWSDYLVKTINFNCLFCDNDGKVSNYGIDEILKLNYKLWKHAVKSKKIDSYNKLSAKKVELMVVQIIRYIFENFKYNNVNDIVTKFNELKQKQTITVPIEIYEEDKWKTQNINITDSDIIKICNKRSIKSLVETVVEIKHIDVEINSAKILIDENDTDCLNTLKSLA